jgi:hypothetical protein
MTLDKIIEKQESGQVYLDKSGVWCSSPYIHKMSATINGGLDLDRNGAKHKGNIIDRWNKKLLSKPKKSKNERIPR